MSSRAFVKCENELSEGQKQEFKVGDEIEYKAGSGNLVEIGTIRFIGNLKHQTGIYAGIEFENPIGAGTGFINGRQIFNAKQNHAAFVELSKLKIRKILDVKFDKADAVYNWGDTVSGVVIIQNDDALEITALTATLVMSRVYKGNNDWSGTDDFQIINLYSELIGNSEARSKVLPAGPNNILFKFSPIPIHYASSMKSDSDTCSYCIRIEMKTRNGKPVMKTREFRVKYLPLNEYDEPQKWQTKTDKKYIPLGLKKSKITVTVPTGFDRREQKIQIHLVISNGSKNPKTIIRSRLLRAKRCPIKSKIKEQVSIQEESVEEINISEGEITHFLKVALDWMPTVCCPLITQTFKLEVEVETSNCTMKVDFPLIIGFWRDGVVTRENAPFELGNNTELKQEPEAPKPKTSEPTMPDQQTPSAPAGTLPIKQLPLPSTTSPGVPTAPPMEVHGVAPPTYQEAIQAPSTSIYPQLRNTVTTEMRATTGYIRSGDNELSFEAGQIFTEVYRTGKPGWLVATMNGRTGMIPEDRVEPFYKF